MAGVTQGIKIRQVISNIAIRLSRLPESLFLVTAICGQVMASVSWMRKRESGLASPEQISLIFYKKKILDNVLIDSQSALAHKLHVIDRL